MLSGSESRQIDQKAIGIQLKTSVQSGDSMRLWKPFDVKPKLLTLMLS